jgi:ABC-type nitrate/sulfonate/bicarbonate transport system permease component
VTRKDAIQGFAAPILLTALWQVSASVKWLDPLFFPPPTALFAEAVRMSGTGELWRHLGATLSRMSAGFLLGVIPGVLCGILMGAVTPVRRFVEPLVSGLNSTPKLTLLPILMLLFGIGETARLLLIAAGCFVTMALQAMDGIGSINKDFVELGVNYGAGHGMLWRKVYLPSAMPQIFTGLRLSVGRALVISISVELVSSGTGLGSMIWMAWQTFTTEKLYVGVILTACLGTALHVGLKHLEARLVPWKE